MTRILGVVAFRVVMKKSSKPFPSLKSELAQRACLMHFVSQGNIYRSRGGLAPIYT